MSSVANNPINAREAAKHAHDYMRELLPEAKNVLLEEVELTGNGWLITLGYDSLIPRSPLEVFGTLARGRDYKQFLVDENGEIRSMKIRVVK